MSAVDRPGARSSAVHLAGAFLLMGGWALFANRMHPMPAPLLAGLVQGTLSAAITFGLKRAIEALSDRLPGIVGLLLPPVIAFAISATLLVALHTVSGTPELVATVAVPLTVSTSYAALYSWALWRRRRG
jgi:fructose-specific phosphotransferase system IIC component